jgi:hypothetical protein
MNRKLLTGLTALLAGCTSQATDGQIQDNYDAHDATVVHDTSNVDTSTNFADSFEVETSSETSHADIQNQDLFSKDVQKECPEDLLSYMPNSDLFPDAWEKGMLKCENNPDSFLNGEMKYDITEKCVQTFESGEHLVNVTGYKWEDKISFLSEKDELIKISSSEWLTTWSKAILEDTERKTVFVVSEKHGDNEAAYSFFTDSIEAVCDTVTLTKTYAGTCDTWFQDKDGDGFGNDLVISYLCEQPEGFVNNGGDCDDKNSAVNPNEIELCDDLDNNCNNQIDEGLECLEVTCTSLEQKTGKVVWMGEEISYDVGLHYVNSNSAVLHVNGERTPIISIDEHFTLNDGMKIQIQNTLHQAYAGGEHNAEFCLSEEFEGTEVYDVPCWGNIDDSLEVGESKEYPWFNGGTTIELVDFESETLPKFIINGKDTGYLTTGVYELESGNKISVTSVSGTMNPDNTTTAVSSTFCVYKDIPCGIGDFMDEGNAQSYWIGNDTPFIKALSIEEGLVEFEIDGEDIPYLTTETTYIKQPLLIGAREILFQGDYEGAVKEVGMCLTQADPLCADGKVPVGSECLEEIFGCTDLEAINYNPNATIDDGSCEYEVVACIASDGYDIYKKGTTEGPSSGEWPLVGEKGIFIQGSEGCVDADTLYEYYCGDDGYIYVDEVACELGCDDGACAEAPEITIINETCLEDYIEFSLTAEQQIADKVSYLDDGDLNMLSDGTLFLEGESYSYEQILKFPQTDSSKVLFTENDDNEEGLFLHIDYSENFTTYELDFNMDVPVSKILQAKGSNLSMGGKEYLITDVEPLGQSGLKIEMVDPHFKELIHEGEMKEYSIDDFFYQVIVPYVDAEGALVEVNGELKSLVPGEQYQLADGTFVGVHDVLFQNYAGGIHAADIYLTDNWLTLEDPDLTDNTSGKLLKHNGEYVDGAPVSLEGNYVGGLLNLHKISVDMFSEDDFYVGINNKLSDAIDEVGEDPNVLFPGWDLQFDNHDGQNGESDFKLGKLCPEEEVACTVLEDFLPDAKGCTDLADFPGCYSTNGTFNGNLVVGENAYAIDNLSMTDVAVYMNQKGVTVINATNLDSEISSICNQNLISIGNPCVNTVTAELEGFPADCSEGYKPGEAKIKLYQTSFGNTAMVIAGYSGTDTRAAAKAIANGLPLSGNELIVLTTNDDE